MLKTILYYKPWLYSTSQKRARTDDDGDDDDDSLAGLVCIILHISLYQYVISSHIMIMLFYSDTLTEVVFLKVVETTIVGMYLLWSKMSVLLVKLHVAVLIQYAFLKMDAQYGLSEVATMVSYFQFSYVQVFCSF